MKTAEHPEGEEITRKYTPTSKVDTKVRFLMIFSFQMNFFF